MPRINGDTTTSRNLVKRMKALVIDYELIKQGKHQQFKFVSEWYRVQKIKRQNFIKYYHRYKLGGNDNDLLPSKRGPKWKTRRPLLFVEQLVLKERDKGCSRYEIHDIIKTKLSKSAPSPSGIYNILKRYSRNKLKRIEKVEKVKIVKTTLGEMGHIDCHYTTKGIIEGYNNRLYIVGLMDDTSRLVHCTVVTDITSLTVMFATLRLINELFNHYKVKFQEILSDNGSEFGHGAKSVTNLLSHPFKRLLHELEIKHRSTRPYRPQTNGKIERFWKTLDEDLLFETVFSSIEEFELELRQYCMYYNEHRKHQSLNNTTPLEYSKTLKHFYET